MVNFGPLTAEIGLLVWGTPTILTGFASWRRYCTVLWRQPNFTTLNRAPPIFGRVAISWDIGPHSIFLLFYRSGPLKFSPTRLRTHMGGMYLPLPRFPNPGREPTKLRFGKYYWLTTCSLAYNRITVTHITTMCNRTLLLATRRRYFISWPTFTLLSLYHCVWRLITAHNLTPEKRDNNYSNRPLTPTTCLRNNIQLITGISPNCGSL